MSPDQRLEPFGLQVICGDSFQKYLRIGWRHCLNALRCATPKSIKGNSLKPNSLAPPNEVGKNRASVEGQAKVARTCLHRIYESGIEHAYSRLNSNLRGEPPFIHPIDAVKPPSVSSYVIRRG